MPNAFAEYAARKEAEALHAPLARWETAAIGGTSDLRAIGNDWTRALFDGDFYVSPAPRDDLPSTSLVFVQSRDGNTVAKDPWTLGGGHTDKHLIYEGLSRVAADGVLAGAETIRGATMVFSVWHPELVGLRETLGLPRHPIQVVATLRGIDIVDGLLFNVPELHVVVVTVPTCHELLRRAIAERPWIDTIVMDRPDDLERALMELRQMGVGTLSCVGGRTLAGQLIDARLIQDLYLTKSSKSAGEPNTPLYPRPLEGRLVSRKTGTGPDAGVTFEHSTLG